MSTGLTNSDVHALALENNGVLYAGSNGGGIFRNSSFLGIDSNVLQTDISVYPNPFSDNLYIQLPENFKGNFTFRVTDLTGKTIYAQSQNDKSFVWNGSSLPKGVYVLSIENNGKTITKKVVKK